MGDIVGFVWRIIGSDCKGIAYLQLMENDLFLNFTWLQVCLVTIAQLCQNANNYGERFREEIQAFRLPCTS